MALAQDKGLRSFPITISPTTPLKALPRHEIVSEPLDPPVTAVPKVEVPEEQPTEPASLAPAPDYLFGRWAYDDVAACSTNRYVVVWTPSTQALILADQPQSERAARYTADGSALKIETFDQAGRFVGFWRVGRVDADTIRWLDYAVAKTDGTDIEIATRPDKLFKRCPPGSEPPVGWFTRMVRVIRHSLGAG